MRKALNQRPATPSNTVCRHCARTNLPSVENCVEFSNRLCRAERPFGKCIPSSQDVIEVFLMLAGVERRVCRLVKHMYFKCGTIKMQQLLPASPLYGGRLQYVRLLLRLMLLRKPFFHSKTDGLQ